MTGRIIQGLEALAPHDRGGVLSIGNFDGVHRGHAAILRRARELADRKGAAAIAMTFDPPAEAVLRPDHQPQRLTPPAVKHRLLLAAGAGAVLVVRPTPEFLGLSPQEFLETIVRAAGPHAFVEGESFFFGRGRGGDVTMLRQAGARMGFDAYVVEAVEQPLPGGPVRISSTLIRRLVAAGEVENAALCLGREYTLYGPVVAGQRRGRELGFPTANVSAGDQVMPAAGVYACRAAVDGREWPAAVSIGTNPTFGPDGKLTVEAFLLGGAGDYYGKDMALAFLQRLRDQVKFETLEKLKEQIAKDVQRVRQIGS